MRQWIVMLQVSSRTEFPTIFVFEGSGGEGKELEDRIRGLFEEKKIVNFVFEPYRHPYRYERANTLLDTILRAGHG